MKLIILLTLSGFLLVQAPLAQEVKFNSSSDPKIVEFFSPFISNRDFTSNAEMDEIFTTIQGYNRSFSAILYIKKVDDKWTTPIVAPFSGQYNDLEPAFSPDGNRVYFASNRPTVDNPQKSDMDIWFSEKTSYGWSEAINIGSPVNTEGNEFYPSIDSDGSLYFTAMYDRANGADIFYSKFENEVYNDPIALSPSINSAGFEINPFIFHDGSFILFSRLISNSSGNIFISFKNNEGNWDEAVPLESINSKGLDYCPFVSQDKKYLFFSRGDTNKDSETKYSYNELLDLLNSNNNGLEKVYSVGFQNIVKEKQD